MSRAAELVHKLQEYANAKDGDLTTAPVEIGKELIELLSKKEDSFLRYVWLGGESATLLVAGKVDKKTSNILYKVALPFASGGGKSWLYQYTDKFNGFWKGSQNTFQQRFLEGAKLQKSLVVDIPSLESVIIPKVYAIEPLPIPHIKMEWVAANSLWDFLVNVSYTSALNLFLRILAGFREIHNWGVIHRDIQPDNILVKGNLPVVLDWTMAKVYTQDRNITSVGYAMGTPLYRSPVMESDSAAASTADDIYSLGMLLAYFITKSHPRTYANEDIKTPRHREAIIDRIAQSLPLNIQPVFRKATNSNTQQRYVTIATFADDLRLAMAKDDIEIIKPGIQLPLLEEHMKMSQSGRIKRVEIKQEYSELMQAFVRAVEQIINKG